MYVTHTKESKGVTVLDFTLKQIISNQKLYNNMYFLLINWFWLYQI